MPAVLERRRRGIFGSQNIADQRERNWISGCLKNDEVTTDEAIRDYFLHSGVSQDRVEKVMSQRQACLKNPMYYQVRF